MQNKVKELNNVITQNPPDMKKLQLVLQGSVSVQVHECCLMYSDVIVLAGKLASKQRRDNCNTTLYLSPKSFDENKLSDVTTR